MLMSDPNKTALQVAIPVWLHLPYDQKHVMTAWANGCTYACHHLFLLMMWEPLYFLVFFILIIFCPLGEVVRAQKRLSSLPPLAFFPVILFKQSSWFKQSSYSELLQKKSAWLLFKNSVLCISMNFCIDTSTVLNVSTYKVKLPYNCEFAYLGPLVWSTMRLLPLINDSDRQILDKGIFRLNNAGHSRASKSVIFSSGTLSDGAR